MSVATLSRKANYFHSLKAVQTTQENVNLGILFQEMETRVSVLCNTCCAIVKLLSFQFVCNALHYLETLDWAIQVFNFKL